VVTLFIGGSKSGKSGLAERFAVSRPCARRLYIATLQPGGDPENLDRIRKHRVSREGCAFETVEIYSPDRLDRFGDSLESCARTVILLDCLGVMLSQGMFVRNADGRWIEIEGGQVERETMRALRKLAGKVADLIIVVPDVFKEPVSDETTERYRRLLGHTIQSIVRELDAAVIEAVAGVPIVWRDPTGDCGRWML